MQRLPRSYICASRRLRLPISIRSFPQRTFSTKNPISASVEDDPPYTNPQQSFARHTLFTLDYFRRVFRFSLIGLLTVAATTWTAFEGAHMWVENIEMDIENDEQLESWGWTDQIDKWSGNPSGGTDLALGFKARHAIRSAWIAQNWGTGSNVISSSTLSKKSSNFGSRPVEASLEFAHEFLNMALSTALAQSPTSSSLHPQTISALLARHANVLERIGSRDALLTARSDYERIWADSKHRRAIESARTALKIGDISSRLGDGDEALEWWSRTLALLYQRTPSSDIPPLVLPESAPTSPLAQRTLASLLTSLSAYYAQTGFYKQAQTVEETGIKLLKDAAAVGETTASSSPSQSLHSLYLLHRTSLLSTHLAEVIHALRADHAVSLHHLQNAAEASETVALTLSGLPLTHPDAPHTTNIPHPPSSDAPLLPIYKQSRTLRTPASNLLRAARRSAAETWRLSGLLHESAADSDTSEANSRALDCYERALGWAGTGTAGQLGDVMLEKDWKDLWSNYVRVRDIVRRSAAKT